MNRLNHSADADLSSRLRSGDRYAFQIIFEENWLDLYTYAFRKIRSKEEAEELVQSVFLELWEKRERFEIVTIKHFLKVCCRNKCIDFIRKKILEGKYEAHHKAYWSLVDNSTEHDIIVHDLSDQIEGGLRTLPEKSQLIFRLSKMEGFTVKEISKQVNLSDKAVEYHLAKALRTLKIYLKDFVLSVIIFLHS